jgi:ABC-type nitrate/sulfonate/bicarbonate transport system permease component
MMRRSLGGAVGIIGVLAVWQLLGVTWFGDSGAVPPPTAIIRQFRDDGWDFYGSNLGTTAREAAWGWLWGNALALGVAALFVLLPFTEKALMRLAIASYCLPIIAIGPILHIVFGVDTARVVLAALSVFFTTLVGMLLGLRSADRTSLDLVHAYGGGAWAQLRKVRLWACLPSLFAALRIAAPAAVLGAIIGEYMGGDSGLGIAMIAAQTSLAVPRTWAIALVATGAAALAYGGTALVGRLLTPWAPRVGR